MRKGEEGGKNGIGHFFGGVVTLWCLHNEDICSVLWFFAQSRCLFLGLPISHWSCHFLVLAQWGFLFWVFDFAQSRCLFLGLPIFSTNGPPTLATGGGPPLQLQEENGVSICGNLRIS